MYCDVISYFQCLLHDLQTSTTQQQHVIFTQKTQKEHKHADTQNKDIMIYTRKSKMIITTSSMLNERSHFVKQEFKNMAVIFRETIRPIKSMNNE